MPKSTLSNDTEIVFEKKVVELAHMFGWMVASFRQAGGSNGGFRTPVKYDGKGYPDLTLVHDAGHIIFAEMKRDKNSSPYSPEQEKWGETLSGAAFNINMRARTTQEMENPQVRYRVWRPRDGDEIATLLSFGRVTTWRP